MRVLMTGGGTGGHVYPALAIAEIIKANIPDAEIAFVGTKKGIENRLVPKAGYKLYHVEIQGVERSLSPKNIKTAYLIMTSPHKAKRIIDEFKPDVVIGTGGYVSWPLLRAAASRGVPCIVHESNAKAGLAVRQVQSCVDMILTSFDQTANGLKYKEKIVNVGNPLRIKYGSISRAEARAKLNIDEKKFVVLSFGGSLGALAINEAAMSLMKDFSSSEDGVVHLHACGRRYSEEFSKNFEAQGFGKNTNIILLDYIYDMPLYMSAADVIICRAGAMTLAELSMMGKPAVLIPSPNVTDNHQYANAEVIANGGGAFLVTEDENMCANVSEAIRKLYQDRKLCEKMGKDMLKFARPDAGKTIYDTIIKLIESKSKIKK